MRTIVGYDRHGTAAELALPNEVWALQSQMTNYFLSQHKLISKVRDRAKVTKKHDKQTTPAGVPSDTTRQPRGQGQLMLT